MPDRIKRTLLPVVFVGLVLTAGIYFIFFYKSEPSSEPLKAIPSSASVIIKVNNFSALLKELNDNNTLWNTLNTIPGVDRINRQMYLLDSLYDHLPEIAQILNYSPSFISAHVTGNEHISIMHAFKLPDKSGEKKISDLITGFVVNAGTINNRTYEGVDIYEVVLLNEHLLNNFSFALTHNILIFSFSTILLEDAIRQLQSDESVMLDREFSNIFSTAGKNVSANIFVNFPLFAKMLSAYVKPDYKAEVRSVKNFAGWAELDINLLPEMLLMNGFINTPDSLSSIVDMFTGQSPQRLTADEILPASVGSFLTLSFSDFDLYYTAFQDYLREQGLYTGYQNTLQSLINAYNLNFRDDLLEIFDNEITLAFDQENQAGKDVSSYVLLRVKSAAQTEDKVLRWIKGIAATESKTTSTYKTDYKFDNELVYPIYHLPVREFTAKIFGSLFSFLDDHYFTILDHYLVFSGSPDALKTLINDYVLNKTLRNDLTYNNFREELSPRSNINFYCNMVKANEIFAPYLENSLNQKWGKHLPVFRKVQTTGFQIYANNGMLYGNLLVKNSDLFSGKTRTVWESKLDTAAGFKPVFVTNHQTGQNEVFVQDLKNNIYLVNQVGRVLWKIHLPEQINSEIYQVDFYNNGKLQLLFSTRNQIYLIDRNGNNVEKYPVRLRSPATCGVSVFDYENNHDYRLFVACEDKHVYLYTKDGNLLPGWHFGKADSEVKQPVNHFRIGSRDFIVFGDDYKTYILDRQGNTRVKADAYFRRSVQNNYVLDIPRDGTGPSILTTDTSGRVYFISFTGKVKMAEPPVSFTGNHFFDCKDLDGDGKAELIYLDNDKLTVFSSDFKEVFSRDFKSGADYRPIYYQFSVTDRKLGIVNKKENKIYLINNDGNLYTGFPLQGNTPFSIGQFGDSLSRFSLVVGNSNNFLLNYRVQ